MWVGAYLVGGLLFAATAATLPPPEEEAPQATTEPEPTGPGKFGDRCTSTEECGFRGSRCDNGACSCRPELPATNHFDKCGVEVDINGTCFFHEQCEMRVPQTECRDNRCSCRFEMKPALNKKNQIECIDLGKDVMRKWTNVRDSFQKNQRKRKEQSKFYERPTTESSLSSDDDQDEATPHTDEDKRKDDSIIEDGARKKMTDALEQELLQLIREKPDRNMFFFKGIIPSLQEFSEDEILEFQISVLNSIAALKEKRKKGLHHCLCKTPSGSQGQYNDFSSVEHGRNPCYHTIPQSRTVPASTMMETADNVPWEPERYVDPTMIGVLVGMALMFIIICVVLRLFSKARWRDNRTIFNTPNPRLMNVSLLRDTKAGSGERRGSRGSNTKPPSRQPSLASLRPTSPSQSHGSRVSSRGSLRGSRSSSGSARSPSRHQKDDLSPNPVQA